MTLGYATSGMFWVKRSKVKVTVNTVVYVCMCQCMCPAGTQLPSPSYSTEKTEQTQQLPLSMDQLLGTSTLRCYF